MALVTTLYSIKDTNKYCKPRKINIQEIMYPASRSFHILSLDLLTKKSAIMPRHMCTNEAIGVNEFNDSKDSSAMIPVLPRMLFNFKYLTFFGSPARIRTRVPGTKTRDDGPLHYGTPLTSSLGPLFVFDGTVIRQYQA